MVTKNDIRKECKKLLDANKENSNDLQNDYDVGYYEGVHDSILDVMAAFGIETNEKYFN